MAGSFETTAGPSYISSSYADNILSDIRPIKLKLEALRSVNVLLDEFLYNILRAAGSLLTDNIKAGLNKVLPTSLGKEAVLEAEMELKAYWERNTPYKPAKEEFDLQWSFELLRLKCEGYTTMNDADEDADAIKRVNDKMSIATGLPIPHASVLAPASLYLTAILEHACQHVLSNVSLVIARDSSRTVATVQDLFTSLCEDASLYNAFKSMDVYDQIESLTKMQHPRRSKSLSKTGVNGRVSPASRTASPIRDVTSSRIRVSSESTRPSSLSQQPASGSNEKSRVRLFGRSSSDHERTELPDPRLAADDAENGNFPEEMDEALQEFDELMRSSATMKVSLTPDRLKSMEVYKQERKRHKIQENDPAQIAAETTRSDGVRRPVDSIQEDDELNTSTVTTTPTPALTPAPTSNMTVLGINNMLQNVIVPRSRLTSLSTSSRASPTPPTRTRSVTISAPLSKKRSIGQMRSPPIPPSATFPPKRGSTTENGSFMQSGRPPRTRKVTRNRESIDLDEVMGDEDDELESEPMTPKKRDPSRPHVSQSARDLISFLDDGPPEELRAPSMHMNASMLSFDSSKTTKSSRLHRMMSKLTLGANDKLGGRVPADEFGRSSQMSRRTPSSSSLASTPPSAYALSMTPKKPLPAVIVGTPPPPLASFRSTSTFSSIESNSPPSVPQSSPPSYASTLSSSNTDSPGPNATRPAQQQRRISITRKAVPTWDSEEQVIIMPPATSKSEKHRSRPSPLDAFPPVPETVNIDGRILPNGHVEVIAEMRARRESRTPSPLDSASQIRRASLVPDALPALHSQSAPTTPRNSATPSPPRPTHSPPPPPESPDQTEEGLPESAAAADRTVEAGTQTATAVEDGVESQSEDMHGGEGKSDVPPRAFMADDAQDLRRLLSVATTADECRLLVDMVLAQCGFASQLQPTCEPSGTAAVAAAASELEEFNEDLERSLVSLLLGEESQNEEHIPCPPSFLQPNAPLVYLSA